LRFGVVCVSVFVPVSDSVSASKLKYALDGIVNAIIAATITAPEKMFFLMKSASIIPCDATTSFGHAAGTPMT